MSGRQPAKIRVLFREVSSDGSADAGRRNSDCAARDPFAAGELLRRAVRLVGPDVFWMDIDLSGRPSVHPALPTGGMIILERPDLAGRTLGPYDRGAPPLRIRDGGPARSLLRAR